MKKQLGGDRLGSGNKLSVDLHGYERSTHDLGYLWRSTMSAGTLVPFLSEVALPGDTFDINLGLDMRTHPTLGPLFGSYKAQLDVFQCPIRLYQGQLHNNKLGIGMNMAAIKLPQIELKAIPVLETVQDIDNAQINPSCILSYLGIRGVGMIDEGDSAFMRKFNGIPLLAYWDIYKNYYANKQEEIGAVIHASVVANTETVDSITVDGASTLVEDGTTPITAYIGQDSYLEVQWTGTKPVASQIMIKLAGPNPNVRIPLDQLFVESSSVAGNTTYIFRWTQWGNRTLESWSYIAADQLNTAAPQVKTFALSEIDDMREEILVFTQETTPFIVNTPALDPYTLLLTTTVGKQTPYLQNQEGLGLKTYQSDLFNNWLSTEWIDGAGGISEITAISTAGDSFTLDTLNLSKKVYDMLNRIAVSGGSYDDWLDAVYAHDRYQRCESPMYMGGLIKELVFQEVVSNSQDGDQPLGTLAGKGVLSQKHKGGSITIKVDEPSWIMGIVSLTPRIDYSQGNKWDTHLKTMDDLHKPALDEIGFQELITEQMHWATTGLNGGAEMRKSAGKQPAWLNYMTNVNQTRGNFAIGADETVGEMFMTLNRRYEIDWADNPPGPTIKDLTTYIDPVKFNHIFADTSIDAQNFWAQIAVDITARRKMSAKLMPNL